jgi:hypothetical protein
MRFFLFILISILNGQNLPFQLGEKLVYSAKFNIIPSGHASLEVLGHESINGVGTYHARFKASTNPTLDRLYKLRDQIDIWLDETDLFTHQLKKNLREGNYHKKIHTIIYYDASLAIINSDYCRNYRTCTRSLLSFLLFTIHSFKCRAIIGIHIFRK